MIFGNHTRWGVNFICAVTVIAVAVIIAGVVFITIGVNNV